MTRLTYPSGMLAQLAWIATAGAQVRAVVDEVGAVVACVVDGVVRSGDDCPEGAAELVSIAPARAGPLVLSTVSGVIEATNDGSGCAPSNTARATGAPTEHVWPKVLDLTERERVWQVIDVPPELERRGAWLVNLDQRGPAEIVFHASSASAMPDSGPFEFVSLAGGAARNVYVTFFEHRWASDDVDSVDTAQRTMAVEHGRIAGLTDLDGDGRLEVVSSWSYHEGSGHGVWAYDGNRFTELVTAKCRP